MATIIDIDGNYQVVVSNHSNWMLQRRLDDKGKVFTTVDSKTKEVKPSPATVGYYPSLGNALSSYAKEEVIAKNKDKIISVQDYIDQLKVNIKYVNGLLEK